MKKFVISLVTAVDRRIHIENEFSKRDVGFEFFDALTPEPAASFAQSLHLNIDEKFLTKGEVACFMSHAYLWKKMVDENIPHLAIFEDDIYLGNDVTRFLNDENWLESAWDLVKLEEFSPRVALGKNVKNFDGEIKRSLFELKSKNLGTAGYILSLEGAKKLLNYIQQLDQLIALDHLMFESLVIENICSVYQLKPALCIQDVTLYSTKDSVKFASHLYKERLTRRKYNKKSGLNKVLLELHRILHQIKSIILFKTVGFK